METAYFVHDERSSSFYSNSQGFEDSEESLFGGIINSELDYSGSHFDQLPTLWDPAEDGPGTISQEADSLASPIDCKEDFQQMLTDWNEHLTSLQIQEPIKLLQNTRTDSIGINSCLPTDMPDLFTNSVGNNLISSPFTNELFPVEFKTEVVDVTNSVEFKTEVIDDIANSVESKQEVVDEITNPIELKTEVVDVDEKDFLLNNANYEHFKKYSITKCKEVDEIHAEETVWEQMPVLEAGDLTSLLEQFEASEGVNIKIEKSPLKSELLQISQTSPMSLISFPSNQSITKSLPQAVIDRIKASGRKKVIPVIPAIPPKKTVKAGTRMQDAGFTLCRNKLLQLVTIGSSGESVQLDHDYCTSTLLQNFYQSEGSECSSHSSTPDVSHSRFFDNCNSLQEQNNESKISKTLWIEKNCKKDSGLESDISDESEEVQIINEINTKGTVVSKNVTGMKSVNLVTETGFVIGSAAVRDHKEMTMISVLKKYNCNNQSTQSSTNVSTNLNVEVQNVLTDSNNPVATKPSKKRKLNLEEYRVRREERERKHNLKTSRSNSPFSLDCSPDSTQDGCVIQKPLMHNVEVQTQISDFGDSELPKTKHETQLKSHRLHQRERRNDNSRRTSYRARRPSSSSSSSTGESSRHRSHRKRKSSRSDRQYRTTSRCWSRSRSRSRSRSSTRSFYTNRSSSSSSSRSQSKYSHHSGKKHNRLPRHSFSKPQNRRDIKRWKSSRSPLRPMRNQEWNGAEKLRQVEERRVIYVGRIEEGTTKAHLRARFEVFGPIIDISVHFRERGDNYGFVTFAYKVDAYEAVEHGNDDPLLPHYDLCFGGRRAFCKQRYADLDGVSTNSNQYHLQRSNDSFDLLLREAQAKLRKRSSV